MTSQHKAAIVPNPGAKHQIVDRPTPAPAADEVLIKVTATAINPVDHKMRDYKVFITEYPAVLGSDAAGEIAEVGSAVKDFAVGDRVFFQGIIGDYDASTFQQYVKMPAKLVAKTPKKISDEQAAGVSLATVAVVVGLYDQSGQGLTPPWEGQAGKGKAAIVLGGSSSVGQYAIQFAKLSGFDRIITNSSASHAEFLKSLGADVVLDRSTQSSPKDFVDAANGLPVEFVQDAISLPDTQKLGVQILQQLNGGNVITVLGADADAAKLGQEGDKKVVIKGIFGKGSAENLRPLTEPLFAHLGGEDGYIAKGQYVPNRPEVVAGGLEGVEEALEKNKKGVSGIKVVIRPFEN